MFAIVEDLRRPSRGSATRLRSADNESEFRVVVVVIGGAAAAAAAGGLYLLFGGLDKQHRIEVLRGRLEALRPTA